MNRCNSIGELFVHHKRRDGGNDIDNAEVLCHTCHVNTSSYGIEGKSPPEFSEETKIAAKERAGHRCECERVGCHVSVEDGRIITEALKMPKYYL